MPKGNELVWFVGGVAVGMFAAPWIMAQIGRFTAQAA